MRVLVTGFGPFGDILDNPTSRLVARLHGRRIHGLEIVGLALPTSFSRAKRVVAARLAEGDLHGVLMTGVADSSDVFRVETLGRNHDRARLPDVDGESPNGPIEPSGPASITITIDGNRLHDAIVAAGLPATLSDDAGAYVCNHVLYTTLRIARVPAAFLHVPADDRTHERPRTTRVLDDHVRAIEAALSVLANASIT
ncbi:MAG: pyroglutamyl-peptidase I family protein [Polyangiales bacterium]